MIRVHGTSLAVHGIGVLLRGASGAGKSDLALRLIDRGACLVADDQTILQRVGQSLFASPPEPIAGVIEIRGIGVFRLSHANGVALGAVVDLVEASALARLPEPDCVEFLGVRLPLFRLAPFEASAVAKLSTLALTIARGNVEGDGMFCATP